MSAFDLFSKRQKRQRGETPDVYKYDVIPVPLRVQAIQIWEEAIGSSEDYYHLPDQLFDSIHQVLCKEYGVFRLRESRDRNRLNIANFLLQESSVEKCLDVIELVFCHIDGPVRRNLGSYHNRSTDPDPAIAELNQRFREHGIGYQFEGGEIIRVDSQVLHQEAVLPALSFLSAPMYKGANQEFMTAHEHYRHGRYKECLNECLKSFESTMKAICAKRKWVFQPTDTAKPLLSVCEQNGLFPPYLQNHLTGLRMALEAGVPTIRNKQSGHGQGTIPTPVSAATASYVLHLTASNILFLASCDKGEGA